MKTRNFLTLSFVFLVAAITIAAFIDNHLKKHSTPESIQLQLKYITIWDGDEFTQKEEAIVQGYKHAVDVFHSGQTSGQTDVYIRVQATNQVYRGIFEQRLCTPNKILLNGKVFRINTVTLLGKLFPIKGAIVSDPKKNENKLYIIAGRAIGDAGKKLRKVFYLEYNPSENPEITQFHDRIEQGRRDAIAIDEHKNSIINAFMEKFGSHPNLIDLKISKEGTGYVIKRRAFIVVSDEIRVNRRVNEDWEMFIGGMVAYCRLKASNLILSGEMKKNGNWLRGQLRPTNGKIVSNLENNNSIALVIQPLSSTEEFYFLPEVALHHLQPE